MFPIPWYAVLFISIPETILIIRLGFILFNLRIEWRETILASIFIVIVSYFLLRLSLIPGVHTLILIFITTLIISWLGKENIWYSLIAIMCGAMIMGVTENVVISVELMLISKTAGDLSSNPWLNIAVFEPILVFIALIFFLMKRSKRILYDLNPKGSSK